LWSNVRAKLLDDGPPRVSGHTTYRSVIPVQEMPEAVRWNAATLWAGPKCHIVHYPLAGWKLFNLVVTCHDDAPKPVSGKAVAAQDVRMRFEHLCPLTRQIIDRGKDWRLWVLCDRDPVKQWVEGRVALLGDAAHPMLQYMAQGACMALEDAVCLAAEMAVHDGDAGRALPGYNSKRYMRTARVQLQSRLMGDLVYHPAGASADLRNEIMRAKTAKDWYEAIDWLYGSTSMAHS
jgi:salicylate hydroxylase